MTASTATTPAPQAKFSFVLEHPPAAPAAAAAHFAARLACETDPSDLKADLDRGTAPLIVIDARGTEYYAECHILGAVSLPQRQIGPETTARFPRDAVLVTYCSGPGCNGATKAALKLAALGFRVKELIGGLEYWRHEGLPVEGTLGESASLYG